MDKNNYEGWLNSDSFLKRAFAVYGYGLVAGLITLIIVWGFAIVVGGIFGGY